MIRFYPSSLALQKLVLQALGDNRLARLLTAGAIALFPACDGSRAGEEVAGAFADHNECYSFDVRELSALQPQVLDIARAAWTIGKDDLPLNMVMSAAFLTDSTLLVVDNLGGRVQLIGIESGRPVANVGRNGQGPGEFHQAGRIVILRSGGFNLADAQNQRIVYFSPDLTPGPVVAAPLQLGDPSSFTIFDGGTEAGQRLESRVTISPERPLGGEDTLKEYSYQYLLLRDSTTVDTLGASVELRATVRGSVVRVPLSSPSNALDVRGDRAAWVGDTGRVAYVTDLSTMSTECIVIDGGLARRSARNPAWLFEGRESWGDEVTAVLRDNGLDPLFVPAIREIRLVQDNSKLLALGFQLHDTPPEMEEYFLVSGENRLVARLQVPLLRQRGSSALRGLTVLAATESSLVGKWREEAFDQEMVGLFGWEPH